MAAEAEAALQVADTVQRPSWMGAAPAASQASPSAASAAALQGPPGGYCFEPEAFAAAGFSAEAFVARLWAAPGLPHETLRGDLERHGALLRTRLIDLLNSEYADFVALSSDLVGTAESLAALGERLGAARSRARQAAEGVQDALAAVDVQLEERARLTARRQTLYALRGVHEAVCTARRLLREEAAGDGEAAAASSPDGDEALAAYRAALARRGRGRGSAEREAARLERVARQLERCRVLAEGLAQFRLVQEAVREAASLGGAFERRLGESLLRALDERRAVPLAACLRAYECAGLVPAAERLVRERVVRPLVAERVTRDRVARREAAVAARRHFCGRPAEALAGVRLRGCVGGEAAAEADAAARRASELGASASSPLRDMYASLAAALERRLGPLLRAAPPAFDFCGASVWEEAAEALGRHADALCSAGDADAFHHSYSETMRFVWYVESLCGSEAALRRLRARPSHAAFRRRWNLSVYFQLRLRQAAAVVEDALAAAAPAGEAPLACDDAGEGFRLAGTAAVWRAAAGCWAPGVLLPELTAHFLKLTLQVLARYTTWVREGLGLADAAAAAAAAGDAEPKAAALAAAKWPAATLATHFEVAADLRALRERVARELVPALAALVAGSPDKGRRLVEHAFFPLLQKWDAATRQLVQRAMVRVAGDCVARLQDVQRVKGRYQMTGLEPPSEASDYVPLLLRPLEEGLEAGAPLFGGTAGASTERAALARNVCRAVSQRYARGVRELMESVRKTEASLLSLKRLQGGGAAAAGAGAGSGEDMSDSNKIRLQLRLDLVAFVGRAARLCSDSASDGGGGGGAGDGLAELQALADELEAERRS